ncbi:hypothetical protein EC991_006342 [Linnemannia zychae]|nr:hypothetical protein EC991_006342 [Linnemannia zychae]
MNVHDVVDTHPHGFQQHSASSTSRTYGQNAHNYRNHDGSTTSSSSSASSLRATANNSGHQQQQGHQERKHVLFPAEETEESPTSPTSPNKMTAATRRTQSYPAGSGAGLKRTPSTNQRRGLQKLAVRGQGVDVSSMDSVFDCIDRQVSVTVLDVSQAEYKVQNNLGNEQFIEWLKLPVKRLGNDEWQQVDAFTNPHGIDPDFLSQRLPLEQLDSYKHYHYAKEQNEDLHVVMEQATLLLLDGGILITLFQVSGQAVVAPILERLSHDYSLARKHGDASFLLQSVIDGIVDQAVPITDAFRHEINNLEARVLALPKMMFTRELHRVTSQLSMLKRTIVPTQMLVHSLRGKDERSPLSPLARTYMGDVMDHCNTMVEDIDSMLSLCEKLINMIFNLIAYDTNESMRRLALVTIIFLPITFVAGVYGTNFQDFPELTHNIGYFWMICGVVFAVFLAAIVGEWVYDHWKAKSVEKRLKRKDPMTIGLNRQGRSLGRRWNSHLYSNPSHEPHEAHALPPRTRMYIGLGVMAFATAGLYISDAMEEKLDPARRSVKVPAPSSQDSGVAK